MPGSGQEAREVVSKGGRTGRQGRDESAQSQPKGCPQGRQGTRGVVPDGLDTTASKRSQAGPCCGALHVRSKLPTTRLAVRPP